MDIEELTQKMHLFVKSQGWYEEGSSRPQTLRNLAISLNLESNEVLEHFQWDDVDASRTLLDDPAKRLAVQEELADVLIDRLRLPILIVIVTQGDDEVRVPTLDEIRD